MTTSTDEITTTLQYADARYEPGLFFAYEHESSTCRWVPQETTIRNARTQLNSPTFDRNGFQMVEHHTAVTDFYDEEQIRSTYRRETEELVQKLTGANKVITYHWSVRDLGRSKRRPAHSAHVDYTEESFKMWARQELGTEADQLLAGRWAAFNVWRGIEPIESTPLAVCDASTLTDEDFYDVPIWLRPDEPQDPPVVGRNLVYNDKQRWYYFPQMQPREALVFRLADSDHSVPRLTAHSAFDDPTSPSDAPPRKSFEIRTLAFFPRKAQP